MVISNNLILIAIFEHGNQYIHTNAPMIMILTFATLPHLASNNTLATFPISDNYFGYDMRVNRSFTGH